MLQDRCGTRVSPRLRFTRAALPRDDVGSRGALECWARPGACAAGAASQKQARSAPSGQHAHVTSVSLPAVTCPGIEAQLSEHVTWRLVSGSPGEYGAQVLLSCSPGYYLEGGRLVQCQANGAWSLGEDRPRCRGESRRAPQACPGVLPRRVEACSPGVSRRAPQVCSV